jgi:hypothetical protein
MEVFTFIEIFIINLLICSVSLNRNFAALVRAEMGLYF